MYVGKIRTFPFSEKARHGFFDSLEDRACCDPFFLTLFPVFAILFLPVWAKFPKK